MPGKMTAQEAHRQYSQSVTAFRKLIPDPQLRLTFARQVDGYFRQCVLGVWQAGDGSGIGPNHVEFYNAIHSGDNPPPNALFWEVATGVAGFDLFRPPAFFQALCRCDRLRGTTLARRFVDQFTLLMLLFAALDDVVSEEEAGFVNQCSDILLALCDGETTKSHTGPIKAAEFVTTRPKGEEKAEGSEAEAPAQEPPPSLEEVMAELDGLCGLEQVKKDVKSLINLVKVRKLREEAGLPVPPMSLHLVFLGNPGTGKTTVARLLAKVYRAIGVLSKGQLVEVDRSGLVAGYVGQTAIKTQQVIESALGGVLFIDEAYSLVNQDSSNDFGREAIEILLKNMEDHRNDLIVIVAGYTHLMERFIHANPGLESRFNKYLYFEDYNDSQLFEIFGSMCRKHGYTLSEEAGQRAKELFRELYENRDENFGNARDVRNLFEQAVARQSDRVVLMEAPTREQLMELQVEDLDKEERV